MLDGTNDIDDNADNDAATADNVITDTHIYSALPTHRWPEALQLILDRVGPDATIPTPETATLLAARSLSTGAIEGVLFLETVLLADRFACVPLSGVSYAAFHALLRSLFGENALYYTAVGPSARAHAAASKAGLTRYAELALPSALAGGGMGERDAVDAGSSGGRSGGELPRGEEGGESGEAERS